MRNQGYIQATGGTGEVFKQNIEIEEGREEVGYRGAISSLKKKGSGDLLNGRKHLQGLKII